MAIASFVAALASWVSKKMGNQRNAPAAMGQVRMVTQWIPMTEWSAMLADGRDHDFFGELVRKVDPTYLPMVEHALAWHRRGELTRSQLQTMFDLAYRYNVISMPVILQPKSAEIH